MGQTLTVNIKNWYNKRFTKDEIKVIQTALNRHALGKQIQVDGIFGPETLDAIKEFQRQHQDELKVDGLAGDNTLAALGITNLANSSLYATRKGKYQGRKSENTGLVSKSEAYARDYYTSPEMIDWLLNPSNASRADYYNHYQNALNYVSPEVASLLRYINDEGDEYDAQVAQNRSEASKRETGIAQFKHAIASGYLKTSEDFDRWMTQHHLSKEEMQELMNDPATTEAMLRAGVIADNGRVNSQQSQSKRFQQDVTNAINEAGVNYALPFMLGVGNVATAGSAAILPMFGSIVGGKTVDKGINLATDGQYYGWQDWSSDVFNVDPENQWMMGMINPGSIGGAMLGGMNFSSYRTPSRVTTQRVQVSPEIKGHWNKNNVVGYTEVQAYPRTGYKRVDIINSRAQVPNEPFYQNAYQVQHKVPYTQQVSGYNKPIYEWIPKVPAQYADKTVLLPGTNKLKFNFEPYGYMPTMHAVTPQRSVVIQEVPDYDRGITYAPWLGYNTVTNHKTGGSLKKKLIKKQYN